MGHSLDAAGKPTFQASPTQTVIDLQAAVDYAEKVGGLLKVTADQRQNLTSSQVKLGWLISETDTGRLYLSTAAKPQGELVHTPETTAALTFAGIYSSSSDSPVTTRSKNGRAQLEGVAVSTVAVFEAGPTYTLGQVAEGYRPAKDQVFAVPAFSTILARLLVQSGGTVLFQVSANFNASLAMGLAGVSWKIG